MLISTVSTVRAPRTDLEMFVNYYLNQGVDRMFLFFDDPLDESFDYFRAGRRLTCVRCDADHWRGAADISSFDRRQAYNARLGLQWARRDAIEWIIHIDHDELIFAKKQSLKDFLSKIDPDVDAVVFRPLEATSKVKCKGHYFEEIHWFKTQTSIIPHAQGIARRLGCRRSFQYGYFRAHDIGKTATRARSSATSLEVHVPTAPPQEKFNIVRAGRAFLAHYDCCTFKDWKQKWKLRLDRPDWVPVMREDRLRQLAAFSTAYRSGSDDQLLETYRQQCILPIYEKIVLFCLGLLRHVRIPPHSFLRPLREVQASDR